MPKNNFFCASEKKIPFFALFLGVYLAGKKTNEAILITLVQLIAIYVLKMLCKFEQNQFTSF